MTTDVLFMGQSNAVGNDPETDGSMFDPHPNVTVWKESTGEWVTPEVGQEPFNASGSNNVGLEFCNRVAEETGQPVRLMLIAKGGRPISEWTGAVAQRTVSATNRVKYYELQAAMAAADDFVPNVMGWIQGEANGGDTLGYYLQEFSFLLEQMDADEYLTPQTTIIVSQLYQGRLGEKGNGASINAVNSNSFLARLTDLGDPRLRIASTSNLEARDKDRVEGAQKSGGHFSDQSMKVLGRERFYAAWMQSMEHYQAPVDFGLEMSRTESGLIGTNLWRGGIVPHNITNAATLAPSQMGQMFDLLDGSRLNLPDYTHPTKYSSGLKGRLGFTVFLRLVNVGRAVVSVEPGGTGGIVRRREIYTDGRLDDKMTIVASGPKQTHAIYMAIWSGGFWEMYLMA